MKIFFKDSLAIIVSVFLCISKLFDLSLTMSVSVDASEGEMFIESISMPYFL
jgi:hypothetical protein